VYLGKSVAANRGRLWVAQHDVDSLIAPILLRRGHSAPRVVKTIVLDPGHGGNDRGNENRKYGLVEKRFTLDVARRLAVLLRARGFRVVLTRTNDRRVELDDRIAIATAAHADLFVSIHFNSFRDGGVSGAETYVMTPEYVHSAPAMEHDTTMRTTKYPGNGFDPWNAILGYEIHRHLVSDLKAEDRGLKRYRYFVLRMVDCPAVLVEPGFLSNSAEGRKVNTRAYRAQIARALCTGIAAYADCVKKAR
jgi:N-acetylmuramoyl-L-alanine amidase